ncbi:MAG: nucleoside-diphosphate sugar epimerase [Fibrobacteres bacterium]|nr:nucleoside-diphosphate sugar epimerase [Fibrobacterota bacterium]
MRIVVTGALGHIGSSLIRELPSLLPGRPIMLVDNMLTQRYCSLFDLPKQGDYTFQEADILTADLDKLLQPGDAVVHLAAITDAANSFQNPGKVEEVNADGTERVARACAAKGCKLLFLSSTSVYGTQAEEVDEECGPDELKPQSPYAESKLKGEAMLTGLGRTAGLRYVIFRFGTIFGVSPGMRFHTAINKFVWQACLGSPITVWRTAIDQQRPYLDLSDAVRAIGFALSKDLFDGKIYNVLTLNTTVRSIADAIKRFVPDLQVKLVDERIMNQLSYRVANERFRKAGFEFQGNLETGIRESVERLSALAAGRLGKKT